MIIHLFPILLDCDVNSRIIANIDTVFNKTSFACPYLAINGHGFGEGKLAFLFENFQIARVGACSVGVPVNRNFIDDRVDDSEFADTESGR